MTFSNKIGDWVITKRGHSALCGTFTVGSRVRIIDINPIRGYTIEDTEGNRMCEIGWII